MAEETTNGANGLSDDALARMLADVERATRCQRWREQALAYDAYLQAGAHPDLLDVPEPVRGRPGSPDTHRDHTMLSALLGADGWAHLTVGMLTQERPWDAVRWEEYSPWRARRERAEAMERVQRDKRRALGLDGNGNGRGDAGGDEGGTA